MTSERSALLRSEEVDEAEFWLVAEGSKEGEGEVGGGEEEVLELVREDVDEVIGVQVELLQRGKRGVHLGLAVSTCPD